MEPFDYFICGVMIGLAGIVVVYAMQLIIEWIKNIFRK